MPQFGLAQPVRRVEDPRLLKGGGRYTDDIAVPGALHGVVPGSLKPSSMNRYCLTWAKIRTKPTTSPHGIRKKRKNFRGCCGKPERSTRPLTPRMIDEKSRRAVDLVCEEEGPVFINFLACSNSFTS